MNKGVTETEDGPCPFCGEMTDSLAGNPGRWALSFTLPDGAGVVRRFHTDCVTERLFRRTAWHDIEALNMKLYGWKK